MTPPTDMTATPRASAIGCRPGGGEGGNRAGDRSHRPAALLKWPACVWWLGTAGGVVALGLAERVAAEAAARSFLAVGAICFAATLASLLPIRNLTRGPRDALPLGLLATIAIRGGTTLCLLIPAIAAGWIERGSVALPIVLWYMAFLITDLVVVNRFLSETLPLPAGPRSERLPHSERRARSERPTRSERTTC